MITGSPMPTQRHQARPSQGQTPRRPTGAGHDGRLLVEALRTTLGAVRIGGGRVIVVDAIDYNARSFYEHFGFKPIPDTAGRLVMKASTAAASVGVDWP